MIKLLTGKIIDDKGRYLHWLKTLVPMLAGLMLAAGCQTDEYFPLPTQSGTNTTEVITLREGDIVKISFPANPNLNKTQPIRRDGMISLDLVGEVKAAGKTPKQLEADLVELYSTQLLSKEVNVEVQSSLLPGLCHRFRAEGGEDRVRPPDHGF